MNDKVSVIVPVYKAEQYLKQCVESLLAQTLDGVEIILVDDGSPDCCGEICDTYAAQFDNIVVLHLKNGGPSRARNRGLAVAHGKYIGFADADDYLHPEMLERLFGEAEENQTDIVMCGYTIDHGGDKRSLKMEYAQTYDGHEEIINGLSARYCTRDHGGLYSVCNKLFDRELLISQHIAFDEDLIRAEDAWFVFDCLKKAKKVRFVNEPLYYYRQVPTSTMHTVQVDRYERSKAFRVKLRKEANELGICIDENEFLSEFLYEAIMYCRSMIQQGKNGEVRKVLSDPFFRDSCRYSNLLPTHCKIVCFLERIQCFRCILLLLKIWARRDG